MQGGQASYFKVTTRAAHDWPALGVAVSLKMDGNTLKEGRFIVGAATDRPTLLVQAARELVGQPVSDLNLKRAGEAAANELDVVSDQHGSSAYKKHLLSVYLGRAVRAAMAV